MMLPKRTRRMENTREIVGKNAMATFSLLSTVAYLSTRDYSLELKPIYIIRSSNGSV